MYNASTISSDKWPPTPSKEYVSVAVVEGGGRCRDEYIGHTLKGNVKQILCGRKEIRLEQILDNITLGLVLVEGAPGIGKSALAWELCRKWEEFSCMKQYSLVVLLRLREEEVQKIESVSQLFCSYKSEDKVSLVDEVSRDHGKGILFILDGFDELPKTLQQTGFLLKLIKKSILPASTVLVTSRPSATPQLLISCLPQKRVEILGFTQESVNAYTYSIFSSEPSKLKKFQDYISMSNNPAINSLMYVPLNAAIIVQIYQDSYYRSNSAALPHTLTELYTQLCLTILRRYVSAIDISTVDKLQDLPDLLHKQFLQICKIAFEGIENEQVIFNGVPQELVQFGFLDSVSALYGVGRVSYNFLHLTIQEFLAAYHISHLRGDGLEVFQQHGGDERWNVVWRFVAGLTKFEHLQGHIMGNKRYIQYREEDKIFVSGHFILCLFEAQTISYFLSPPRPKVCIRYGMDTPLDMYALGYCISKIPTGMAWDVSFPSSTSSDDVEYFTNPFMKNTSNANVIRELHSTNNFFPLGDFKHLPLQEIRFLHLIYSELTITDLVHLSELIPKMPSLECLNLWSTPCQDDYGFLKVLQQLSHSNVTSLNVKGTGFCLMLRKSNSHRGEYISAMKSLIHPSSGRLQELRAGDEFVFGYEDDGVCGTLASLLCPPSSLRALHLGSDWYRLGPAGQSLAIKIVKHNKTLQFLRIELYIEEEDYFLSDIADALQENTTLERVEVECEDDISRELRALDSRLVWITK